MSIESYFQGLLPPIIILLYFIKGTLQNLQEKIQLMNGSAIVWRILEIRQTMLVCILHITGHLHI